MPWREELLGPTLVIRPVGAPPGLLVAFSGRGDAPAGERSATAFLARRLADALGLDGTPIVRATQVHGNRARTIDAAGPPGSATDAGECDALASAAPGVALAVQTADCVPILLASPTAVGAAHAGWRGAARNVAASAVEAVAALGNGPAELRAWRGPSIGPCCYEVGGEVAAQFAGEHVRAGCGGRFRLDLAAVNRAQLEAAGIPRQNIDVHPGCTLCGGRKFASYRRDGKSSGRMIGLVMRK